MADFKWIRNVSAPNDEQLKWEIDLEPEHLPKSAKLNQYFTKFKNSLQNYNINATHPYLQPRTLSLRLKVPLMSQG